MAGDGSGRHGHQLQGLSTAPAADSQSRANPGETVLHFLPTVPLGVDSLISSSTIQLPVEKVAGGLISSVVKSEATHIHTLGPQEEEYQILKPCLLQKATLCTPVKGIPFTLQTDGKE